MNGAELLACPKNQHRDFQRSLHASLRRETARPLQQAGQFGSAPRQAITVPFALQNRHGSAAPRAGHLPPVIPTPPKARQRHGPGERARPRVHQHAPPRADLKKITAAGRWNLRHVGRAAHPTAPEGWRAPRDRALPRHLSEVGTQASFAMKPANEILRRSRSPFVKIRSIRG